MIKNLVKGAIIGGLVVYMWGFVSWGIMSWHMDAMHSVKNEQQVQEVLKENTLDQKGVYLVPSWAKDDSKEKSSKPFAMITYVPEGLSSDMTSNHVFSLFTQVLVALLITVLLSRTGKRDYWCKVRFVTVVGLTIAVASYLPLWNWWSVPMDYIIPGFADLIIQWFLAGLAMAKFVNFE